MRDYRPILDEAKQYVPEGFVSLDDFMAKQYARPGVEDRRSML